MYTINDLTDMFGLSRRTIYYYISEGVLPRPTRGMHARYTDEHVRILRAVRREVHDRVTLADLAERRLIEQEARG